MTSERATHLLLLTGVALLVLSAAPASAGSGYVAPVAEIPLTAPLSTGARSLGMGGVGVAVANDGTALTVNPAGLARLRRIELSGSFRRAATDVAGEMSGSPFESSVSRTDVSAFRAAYPFPTFRGSLVMGFAVEMLYDFTDDRLAGYEGAVSWTEPMSDSPDVELEGDWGQIEDYLSDGGVYSWSAGAAVDVSPSAAVGVALSYLAGEYSYVFRWDLEDVNDVSDAYTEVHQLEDVAVDVSGFRATIGTTYYVSDQLSFGVAVDTPFTLTFEGSRRDYILKDSPDTAHHFSHDQTVPFVDEITLPFALRAGVSYAPTDFVLLGADVHYTDWSELDYMGPLAVVEGEGENEGGMPVRRSLYEETFGYAVGVEVIIPSWPLRLRGGYSSRPLAYRGLDIDSDRSSVTLGAGFLIDTVLALDVAWVRGTYDRSDSEYAFDESVTDEALVLEVSYRF